jgi:hypothetical protein
VIARVFVDQCFSLEHNTGSVFNKLFETETLAGILDAQYRDDYETLLRHASGGGAQVLEAPRVAPAPRARPHLAGGPGDGHVR